MVGSLILMPNKNLNNSDNKQAGQKMKVIKGSIDINKPRDLVVKLFAESKFLAEYQDGFVRKGLINGQVGEQGAISQEPRKEPLGQVLNRA